MAKAKLVANVETSKKRLVGVVSKIRKAFQWFEEMAKSVKEGAVEKLRAEYRTKGKIIEPDKLVATVDELEEIQKKLNALGVRSVELLNLLLAHWGHTGVKDIVGNLGKTLIFESFKLTLDLDMVQHTLTDAQWRAITDRVLNPKRLLALAQNNDDLRTMLVKAIGASATVSVVLPSSRRPKSGQTGEDEDE